MFSCLLCGKCKTLCPLGINLEEVFYYGRNLLQKTDKKRNLFRLFSKFAFQNTDMSIAISKPFHKIINRSLIHKGLLPKDIEYCETPFQKTGVFRAKDDKIGRVAVFSGCTVKHVYPELAFSLGHVLSFHNYEVVFPNAEVCCGAPFRSLGMDDTAKKYARKNYDIFRHLNVDAIVSLCPTCVVALKMYYPKLLGESFSDNIYDVSTFLIDKIKAATKPFEQKVTYHDPCHSINILNTKHEPRQLLKSVGAEVVEPDKSICCGFGGTFSFFFKQTSKAILQASIHNLNNTGASSIVTGCPNCILQLSKQIGDKPIYHIIEVIEEALL